METSHCYQIFGFSAECNLPIPGLNPIQRRTPDLNIVLGRTPWTDFSSRPLPERLLFGSSIYTDSHEPAFRIFQSGMTTRILYWDGAEFWLNTDAGEIWGRWPGSVGSHDAFAYLLGPVFGLFLAMRGVVSLHASAIGVAGKAILFIGDAGAGKSTTAAAMTRGGHALLADDITAITEREGAFFATPAFPYVSLWPDSAEMIGATEANLYNSGETGVKGRFCPANFQASPLPLGAIFVLGERLPGNHPPRSEELSAQQRLIALVGNSYAASVLDSQARTREFRLFGKMTQDVPIWGLHAQRDPSYLGQLCELIEEKCLSSLTIRK